MAHHKRKRPRTATGGGYSSRGLEYRLGIEPDAVRWLGNWPRWHDKAYHTRPARHRTVALETAVTRGADPDDLAWPDGRKPHMYYW